MDKSAKPYTRKLLVILDNLFYFPFRILPKHNDK